jgi:sortase A
MVMERWIAATTNGDSAPSAPGSLSAPEADEDLTEGPPPSAGSGRGSEFRGEPRTEDVGSAPLWVRFCEDMVASALAERAHDADWPAVLSGVDWPGIQELGRVAPSPDAVGRAVVASHRIARELRDRAGTQGAGGTSKVGPGVSPATTLPAPLDPSSLATDFVVPQPPVAFVNGSVLDEEGISLPASSEEDAAQTEASGQRSQTGARLRTLRALFVAAGWARNIGLVVLLFAAWQLWGTSIEQAHAQQALRVEFQTHEHQVASPPTGPALISANTRLSEPPEGSVVGHLQIPAIGVDQYVVEGTAEGDLAKGPGHYVGTSMPGQAGNVAIAGHRTTNGAPFNDLNLLKINDRVTLTTDTGEVLTYVVSQPPVAVSPADVAVLNTGNDSRLTLTTCNPKFSASQRLVVVALLSQPQSAAATTVTVTSRETHIVTGSTGWNLDYLPEAAGILVLLVFLGLFNGRARKVFGRIGHVLLMTPIWVAGLYLLFLTLTQLLPANL